MDRMAGFYRTCAVAARVIPVGELRRLARNMQELGVGVDSEMAVWNMETVIKHCSTKDKSGVTGALVGWSPFPVENLNRYVLASLCLMVPCITTMSLWY